MATTSPARSRSSLARRRPWASGSGRCQLLTILLLAGLIGRSHVRGDYLDADDDSADGDNADNVPL